MFAPNEVFSPGAVPTVVRSGEMPGFFGMVATTTSESQTFVPANPLRRVVTIQNIGAADVYVGFGSSFPVYPCVVPMGGSATFYSRGEIRVKASAGSINVRAQEETY